MPGFDEISFGSSEEAPAPVGESASPEPINEDSLAEGFLKNIPDGDRSVVAKYVKDWDSGVTKKFQSIHEQYKPYKSLGDVEQAQRLARLQERLEKDPVGTYRLMREALVETFGEDFDKDDTMPGFGEQLDDNEPEGQGFNPEKTGIQDPNEQRYQQQQQELQELKTWKEQQETSAREAQENAQFDALLNSLHTKHGNFDDAWVTLQIANGASPEQAMQLWSQFTESIVGSRRSRPAPPIIGGQGGVPSNQVDVTTLKGQDRRNAVKAFLDISNSQ